MIEGEVGRDVAHSGGTAFASIYDTEPLADIDYQDDESFIAGLKALHGNRVERKEDAGLISPASFDPEMDEKTSRGLGNIRHLRGIWLDNDGGDLTPEAFASLLPRLRVVVWNTFSSTPERPRWRAFIPTTEAMSKNAHTLIMGEILRRVNKAGFWSPEQLAARPRAKTRLLHGFDLSKLTASSLFYLPAQAEDPKGSFFRDFTGAKRGPLEPANWITWAAKHGIGEVNARPAPRPILRPIETCGGGTAKLRTIRAAIANAGLVASRRDAAIGQWRSVCQGIGGGHKEFHLLAVGLRGAGLAGAELVDILHDEAVYARHPDERRREIRRLVRGLP
jgi:hypothetical protein